MENKEMFAENEVKKENNSNNNAVKTVAIIGGTVLVGRFVYKKVIKPRLVNGIANLMREAQEQINNEDSKK